MKLRSCLASVALIACIVSVAHAQRARVGVMALFTCDRSAPFYVEMRKLGYVEGRNVQYDCVLTSDRLNEAPDLAQSLVARRPDVIVTASTVLIAAARSATSTIPIVMQSTPDAVREGFAQSLARPGGNITGLTLNSIELVQKRLEIAREILPRARRLAVLSRRGGAPEFMRAFSSDMAQASLRLGFEVTNYLATDAKEVDSVLAKIAGDRQELLYIVDSPAFTGPNAAQIGRLTVQHGLPSVSAAPSLAAGGVMLTLNVDNSAIAARVASYVDRILKGAKPGEMAIEQPSRYTLSINRRTATALGITVPVSLLRRADEVID